MAGLNRSLSLQTTSSGGLFGSNPTNQQSQAGTLFGAAAQSSKPTLSFGTTATTSQPTTSLFGSTAMSSQPASNLFGAAPATAQQSGGWNFSGQTSSSSPFGASTQPQQGSSIFGTAQSRPGGLLGQQSTSAGTSSLLGSSATQSRPSLFGMPNPQPQQGSSLFGASSQPQQTVPGVKIDLSNIKPTTRFSELHEDVQRVIMEVDEFIQRQVKYATELQESIPARGAALETIPGDVDYLTQRVEIVEEALESDAQDIKKVKDDLATDQSDATRCFNAIENLKLPSQYHYTGLAAASMRAGGGGDEEGMGSTSDLIPYFEAKTKEVDGRLQKYAANLAEVEEHMSTVEASAVEQFEKLVYRRGKPGEWSNDEIKELVGTLVDFENAILRVAGKVGEAREGIVELTLGGDAGAQNGNGGRRGGRW